MRPFARGAIVRTISAGVAVSGLLLTVPGPGAGMAAARAPVADTGPLAVTRAGWVRGLAGPGGTEQFLGLRYAQPPVGSLRWRPPQQVRSWLGVQPATTFGDRCVQPPSLNGTSGGLVGSEDCLYLNVYVPRRLRAERLPVMVWVHGGSALVGAGSDTDPTTLARVGRVIVVTINYRLGPLGFLAAPGLSAEEPDRTSGNYGVQDVIAALRWVRDDIPAFGGDPRRVTAFGESAGGVMINNLLTSPSAAGLFQRAIIESGPLTLTLDALPAAERAGSSYATAVGCPVNGSGGAGGSSGSDVAACLRSKSPAQVLAPWSTRSWGGNVDGKTLPTQPLDAIAAGRFTRIPVIEGSNRNEASIGIADAFDRKGGPLTAGAYPFVLGYLFGYKANLVQAEYPVTAYPSPDQALVAATTDGGFSCSALRDQTDLSRATRTYAYEFDDPQAPVPPGYQGLSFPLGSYHTAEIQYVFASDPANLTSSQLALARRIQEYWTTFARFGRPAAVGAPLWARFNAGHPAVHKLSPGPAGDGAVTSFAAAHHCPFWAKYAAAT
jgi:para-nitrobenzyl esterase